MARFTHLRKTVLLASVIALLPFGAFADEHYHDKKAHDAASQQFLTEIGATPEQRAQFETHHKEYEAKVNPVRTELAQKKESLIEYLASPKATKKEAIARQAEVDKLQEQMNRFYIDHVFTKRAYIKPEQQEKANAFFQRQVEEWKKNNTSNVSSGHDAHHHAH